MTRVKWLTEFSLLLSFCLIFFFVQCIHISHTIQRLCTAVMYSFNQTRAAQNLRVVETLLCQVWVVLRSLSLYVFTVLWACPLWKAASTSRFVFFRDSVFLSHWNLTNYGNAMPEYDYIKQLNLFWENGCHIIFFSCLFNEIKEKGKIFLTRVKLWKINQN